ncbi:MAG: phosphonate ABC transporter, permease protein PhnE, partial [Rhizobium altiplani]|uniref:phosphonate ABC transporter, permease protein PhnE n=1 Tax=Rhizobium altiplani TaxID=1864509 RepID=UPI0030F00606
MTVIDANRMHEIEQRYPEYFKRSFKQRFGGLMIVIATLVYALYATWFFDLPKLLAEAHWERVGLYLSQWVSYDVQPEFRIGDDGITVKYPRFSPLGDDPHPDWVVRNPDGSLTASVRGTSRTVTISSKETVVTAHGISVPVDFSSGAPKVVGPVPAWMTVYDDNVLADLGFAGDVSISVDRVKVRKRFLGWANFVFDTQSPFFDKPATEVISLIVSGPDLKHGQSNLSLAFDNIWHNSAWQHGDVWTKLFQTIVMAFLGTLLGALLAFPLAFLAARNITPNKVLNQVLKRFFD